MSFIKMHALGNDFVILDKGTEGIHGLDALIKAISHRRFGIGCDQVLLRCYLDQDTISMDVYNQDGSHAKGCGNGTRCFAMLHYIETGRNQCKIVVGPKTLHCSVEDGLVEVNMGQVDMMPSWEVTQSIKAMLSQYQRDCEAMCVDVGNRHVVVFGQSLMHEDIQVLAPQIERCVPGGVNVNFAKVVVKGNDTQIDIVVWEQGVGFTMACGTGATATFASACKLGFVEGATCINFECGSLWMRQVHGEIFMKGEGCLVAKGVFYQMSPDAMPQDIGIEL